VVCVTTVVSTTAVSTELEDPDEPPQALSANNETVTIEPNTSERFFMVRSL
jgi:hypothetical protein